MAPILKSLTSILFLLAGLATAQTPEHGDTSTMGPSALMWPPDRVWSADQDNIAPCGSADGVGERTEMPIGRGKIAFVGQDEAWNVQVAISLDNNPESNDDFDVIIPSQLLTELDVGHSCVDLPTPPGASRRGTNATVQIKYTADFDQPINQTFYACADITFVDSATFTAYIPCFNATEEDEPSATQSTSPSITPTATPTNSPVPATSSGSSSGLSGGAIAGIVIACVAGIAAVVLGFWLFRRREQKKRAATQQKSLRGVKWEDRYRGGESRPESNASVPLGDITQSK